MAYKIINIHNLQNNGNIYTKVCYCAVNKEMWI